MLAAAQVLIDPNCRALAIAYAVDDESRTKYAVPAGKDAAGRRHQRLWIHSDQPTGRDLNFVFRSQEIKAGRLPDRHDDRVAFDLRFTVLVKCWIEPSILIEDPLGFQSFEG